jgi:tRNA (mo5U34)-methyltransferase
MTAEGVETARDPSTRRISDQVAGRDWYHSIALGEGIVTPGWFDTRRVSEKFPWPDLAGKRCLDIGTFDGFWAFEMERRGASAVVAIDILDDRRWDWPAISGAVDRDAIARRKAGGDGFMIAAEALQSRVTRIDCSVYELSQREHGSFDFIYLGSLLLHLRDPILALERVRSVCKGTLLSVDAIDLPLTILQPFRPTTYLEAETRPYWHRPNLRGFKRMVSSAGFDVLAGPRPFLMPAGDGFGHPPRRLSSLRTRQGRDALFASLFGDPHAWLVARPRPTGNGP